MPQDLCEACGRTEDRTEQLDRAAKMYGGFICLGCLVVYLMERIENHLTAGKEAH